MDELQLAISGIYAEFGSYLAEKLDGRVLNSDEISMNDCGIEYGWRNMAVITQELGQDRLPNVVNNLVDFYQRTTDWNVWSFAEVELGAYGFQKWEYDTPAMIRRGGPTVVPRSQIEIVEVTSQDQIEQFEEARNLAHSNERRPENLNVKTLGNQWKMWIGLLDGEVVATAALFESNDLALLKYVRTVGQQRNRGYGAAISAYAMSKVTDRPIVLDSTPKAVRMYERLGFEAVGSLKYWQPVASRQ